MGIFHRGKVRAEELKQVAELIRLELARSHDALVTGDNRHLLVGNRVLPTLLMISIHFALGSGVAMRLMTKLARSVDSFVGGVRIWKT